MSNQVENSSTIMGIVYTVISRLRLNLNEYEWLEQCAIDSWREVNIQQGVSVETIKLSPTPSLIYKLPNDFVDYCLIGMNVSGRIITLGVNNGLVHGDFKATCLADIDAAKALDSSQVQQLGGYSFCGGDQKMFGVGGGFAENYYKVDKTKKIITLEAAIPSYELLVDYVSVGKSLSGRTIIPWSWVPAIRDYVVWQKLEHDRTVPYNEKRSKERQYLRSKEASVMSDLPTLIEIADVLNAGTHMGIKRP